MPYKFEYTKKKIPRELDRRVKIDLEERKEIKNKYGKISQRKLARAFGVSRRLIQFIGDPDKKKRNLESRAKRGGTSIYYDKKKNTISMKKHRKYKQELNKKGLLRKVK